jgi:fatty-acyl-CoA synthase
MMRYNLNLLTILERAKNLFPKKEIVSKEEDGTIFRYDYAGLYKRVCKLANALEELGIKDGDKVGTLCWNTHRHLELYFSSCMGSVYHTVNLRLSPEQIAYVINHAGDRILFLDSDQIPVIEKIQEKLKTVEHFVVVGKEREYETAFPSLSYEELINGKGSSYDWPNVDEWSPAGMAYTSGTTGLPKGVIYTHRGIVLHTLAISLPDGMKMSERRVVLNVVPMFHVNSWGIPFAATMVGAKQVFPGQHPTPKDYVELIESEKVDFVACVPTVWYMIYEFLKENEGYDISSLKEAYTGGSPPPASLLKAFSEEFGVRIIHTYGLTETTPVLTVNRPKSYMKLEGEAYYDHMRKQGLILPLIDFRIEALDERRGELLVKGPWVASEYYKDEEKSKEKFVNGWFKTEDIVEMDEEGYIKIVDRAKDLIKSGGEWISSIELENYLMQHQAVKEAVVIGIPHPKWQERPLAFVSLESEGREGLKDELKEFLAKKFPKWWLPDEIIFVREIPKTSVGKFNKRELKERYREYFS